MDFLRAHSVDQVLTLDVNQVSAFLIVGEIGADALSAHFVPDPRYFHRHLLVMHLGLDPCRSHGVRPFLQPIHHES